MVFMECWLQFCEMGKARNRDTRDTILKEWINKIHLADCMDIMKDMPDDYIDLAIVDPPYFKGPELKEYYGKVCSSTSVNRLHIKSEHWEKVTSDYFIELKRISKKYIFWGCNYYSNFKFHTGRIIWDKVNSDSDFSDCEIASTDLFDHVRQIEYMWNGMMQGKSIKEGRVQQGNKKLNEKRIHPTQKPIQLYRWLLQNYAKPGWIICDTHSGSGSLACACHLEKFDFIAIEKDIDYHRDSVNRLDEIRSQGTLF